MIKKHIHDCHTLKRRSLLKIGAASCTAGFIGSGISCLFKQSEAKAEEPTHDKYKNFIYTVCANNCGSTCVLKAFVEDDKVVAIETDNGVEDDWENGIFQVRACPRGRSMRRHMYAPTRLKYPMKRVGKRGEGKFERISWDEALDIVADKLRYCISNYGNASIMNVNASGVTTGPLTRRETAWRFFNTIGGMVIGMRDFSSAQNQAALSYFYGKAGYSGNAVTDIAHTKLAVFFGANFIETRMSGGGLQYELMEAKRKGNTKIIVIDPRFSDTCVTVADEWIPIRPGTDAALAAAIAYQLINEDMLDKDFLATHTVGFDQGSMPDGAPDMSSYSDYILGTGYDKIAKTPQWASAITGIPQERIIQLAREIGMAKPCYITQGWGVQRQAAGEMNTLSIAALACLTGNMGIRGGGNGDYDSYYPFPVPKMPTGTNPVKVTFPTFLWVKAVDDGKNMTADKDSVVGADKLSTDIKFLWNYAGNHLMNQHADINHTKKVLADETKCEMIVMMETHMTASAKWADILLPSCMYPEQTDIQGPSYSMDTDWLLVTGEVKPFFESRPLYDVVRDLAKRMGTEEAFTEGRSREDWIEYLYQNNCRSIWPELPSTAKEARAQGIQRRKKSRDFPVPFADFKKDPEANPLSTPSGKVELFSSTLYEISKTWKLSDKKGDVIPPTPQYVATWDGYEDTETKKKYPLQMIGHHYKGRTHSHYANVDWLLEVSPQNLWINPIDAESRGIKHGDMLKVYNDRGVVHIPAKITNRIMPGVISLPQGAWHKPDINGVDTGGCINTLTLFHPSPLAKGNPQHTNLVQVAKL